MSMQLTTIMLLTQKFCTFMVLTGDLTTCSDKCSRLLTTGSFLSLEKIEELVENIHLENPHALSLSQPFIPDP